MTKEDPTTFFYKTSYKAESKEVNVRNKRKKMTTIRELLHKPAYSKKQELNVYKKKDLKELMTIDFNFFVY